MPAIALQPVLHRQADLERWRNGLLPATRVLDLRRLVNVSADVPLRLTTRLEVPAPERLAQEPAEPSVLDSRGAIQAAERNVSMRRLGVKIAKAAYLPSASLRFNYGKFMYQNGLFAFSGTSWKNDLTAGITVDVPIFDGLRRQAGVDQARVEQQSGQEREQRPEHQERRGDQDPVGLPQAAESGSNRGERCHCQLL